MAMEEKEKYITKTNLLKDRNWTCSLIKKFLPVPHKTKPNPYYRSSPPVKLYDIDEVKQIEKKSQFKILFEKAVKRKKAAKKGAKTKRDRILKYINELDISILKFNRKKLLKEAIRSYNSRSVYEYADLKSNKSFLDRIQVNFIRHQLSAYDNIIDDISGKTGCHDAYVELREIIFEKISKAYPHLRKECERQLIFN